MNNNRKCVCVHGHFYQPPRENAWLEEVELQDSAYPYHDWNERVTAECYAPNTASRIMGPGDRVIIIGNNYSRISFNFGPTLLTWMERHARDIYDEILEADMESARRFSGHGSAMAQAYSHLIMPLANSNDKYTQVLWGIKDFQKRFKRDPEGMWLPETAVDYETLDIMAGLGIKYTVLAPRQAKSMRRIGEQDWTDVNGGRIDPRMPYQCILPSDRSITLFFYDGPISRDIAFGDLLRNGENFANRLLSVFSTDDSPQLSHIATDGETYGHHHQFGDMALGYCLRYIETDQRAAVTNYGEYLEKYPPTHEAQIHENSSWSCIHGIERWRSDCGCNSGMHPEWNQAWRKPLREALDWLRDTLIPLYEKEITKFLLDPWKARNEYIEVISDRSDDNLRRFLGSNSRKGLSEEETVTVLELLEMQRQSMQMYTSCGWFFDEISGIETTQVLQYACRTIQLAQQLSSISLEQVFLKYLETAPSNLPQYGNGAKIYTLFAKPAEVDYLRVGAHYAIASLFDEYPQRGRIYCYTADSDIFEKQAVGKSTLFILRSVIRSEITRERARVSSAVLYIGDYNLNATARRFISDEASKKMRDDIVRSFHMADIVGVLKQMELHFNDTYSFANLFKDEQRKLLEKIIDPALNEVYVSLDSICNSTCMMIDFLQRLHIPIPRDLIKIVSYKVNYEIQKSFQDDIDLSLFNKMIQETRRWSLDIDRERIGYRASAWINEMMGQLEREIEDLSKLNRIAKVLQLLNSLSIPLNLWKAQNIYDRIRRTAKTGIRQRAEAGDSQDRNWLEHFHRLGMQLRIEDGL